MPLACKPRQTIIFSFYASCCWICLCLCLFDTEAQMFCVLAVSETQKTDISPRTIRYQHFLARRYIYTHHSTKARRWMVSCGVDSCNILILYGNIWIWVFTEFCTLEYGVPNLRTTFLSVLWIYVCKLVIPVWTTISDTKRLPCPILFSMLSWNSSFQTIGGLSSNQVGTFYILCESSFQLLSQNWFACTD